MNAFLEFIKKHKFTVLFVLVGLILSILFFTISSNKSSTNLLFSLLSFIIPNLSLIRL